ncbi:MAG: hypothetical protein A2X49_10435 [Lentisphaerae bacterium GWF2_52_8]|nr:MAG: hypothetical protein A2X49_10435 [Lentisphaerae bacterium GWF2_52_8]
MVVAIIILLISILLPALSKTREVAKRIACVSNQRQLSLAWNNYCIDYGGRLPAYDTTIWGDLGGEGNHWPWPITMRDHLSKAVSGTTIKKNSFLMCPSFPVNQNQNYWNPEYGMNVYGIGGGTAVDSKQYTKVSNIKSPSEQGAFTDSYIPWSSNAGYYGIWPQGGNAGSMINFRHSTKTNVLFCDGHVEPKDRLWVYPPWGWWNKVPWGSP